MNYAFYDLVGNLGVVLIIGIGVLRATSVVIRRTFAGYAQWRSAESITNQVTDRLIEQPVRRTELAGKLDATSGSYRFAAAVAGFGQILRGGRYTGDFGYDGVLDLARGARGDDPFGYRGEFLQLANLASGL